MSLSQDPSGKESWTDETKVELSAKTRHSTVHHNRIEAKKRTQHLHKEMVEVQRRFLGCFAAFGTGGLDLWDWGSFKLLLAERIPQLRENWSSLQEKNAPTFQLKGARSLLMVLGSQ